MAISFIKSLLNNISYFLQLSSCGNINVDLVQKYYQKAEEILKLLKSVLDAILKCELSSSDEILNKMIELGHSVDELKELFENWLLLSSKVYSVMQIETLLSRIQRWSLDMLHLLVSYNHDLPEELSSASLELYIQKVKHMDCEQTTLILKEALRDQAEDVGPSSEVLVKIGGCLGLISNQEILIEAVALEKLKENAEQAEKTEEVELINQLIAIVTQLHDRLVMIKQSQNCSPVPIPPDFCCPLSLELMTDPVIVASSQTYERAYIKTWIELGLTVCPKTRQTLGHTILIPNYTVKALIAIWCESNNVKLPDPVKSVSFDRCLPLVHAEPGPARDSHIFPYSRGAQPLRIVSSIATESRDDLSVIEIQVRKLVEDLKSSSLDTQREATAELRLLAGNSTDNQIIIADSGAINSLVELLRSTDTKIQENAVTALLNLSINDNNRSAIANANAIEPLIYVLESGSPKAKENSAATLFSLSFIKENKIRIGRSGAIAPLVDLLGNGTPRGKKYAATALFKLSIHYENRARIVQAGAVRHLVNLMDPAAGMVDKAVAVLANLATIFEGRTAIGQERGIPVLVEVVEVGSARGKKNAAAALLQLCINSNRFCNIVLQEGAVPPLVALSQCGTPRAKEKAHQLLVYFRSLRHANTGRA